MDDDEENQSLLRLSDLSVVRIKVYGMKCQSCVRKIEENTKKKLGIASVKVILDDKEAVVEYDPTLRDPSEIVESIEKLGFKSYLKNEDNNEITVKVFIHGMRCKNCVNKIESNISTITGVREIKVDLENKLATTKLDSKLISPSDVVTAIIELDSNKFKASLSPIVDENDGKKLETAVVGSINGDVNKLTKGFFHVQGMTW